MNAGPNATRNTSFRCAPKARRIPNSFSRLLTEYAAIPKTPVIDSIAPIMPSAPSGTVATRERNRTTSRRLFHVLASTGISADRFGHRTKEAAGQNSDTTVFTKAHEPGGSVSDLEQGMKVTCFGKFEGRNRLVASKINIRQPRK